MTRDRLVAAALLLVLFVVGALTHRDAVSPSLDAHASGDVGPGGYRGWYELLAGEGLTTGRFRMHHGALQRDAVGTLVVAFPGPGVSVVWDAAERDALRAWVREGGRLVDVGAWPPAGRGDATGARVLYDERAGIGGGALRGGWARYAAGIARPRGRLVAATGAHVETLLGDRAGALVVRYRDGRGEVIAVADASWFENRALARNARLAYLVATGFRTAPVHAIVFDEAIRGDIVAKPWYRALDAPTLLALAFLALGGVLWIVRGLIPLGPPVRAIAPREPTSAEFVDAVAGLYRRARLREHARDALAADLRRNVERAPRIAVDTALREHAAAADRAPLAADEELVALARLARTVREESVRGDDSHRGFAAAARGAQPRRRRR